ncbi:MAG TPA: CAP domain-containing protein [Paracoccus solventivorans]|uniref:CAP domain-containing protein n=1 Tax=Paracoccus solventivorans TaxID=53463 RepID=UPI002B7E61AC|nr:CAP domain-containing protein [Paracoccus solventivorans]HMM09997.1 CAP domain-containing protein [Paracoccus solventivorans]
MTKLTLAAGIALMMTLSACAIAPPPQIGPDGQPIPTAYRITPMDQAQIPNRVLTQINLLRSQQGMQSLTLNPQLAAAAMAHSRDMSAQNRAWHFGSDGSSPLDRVRRQGYAGSLLGEDISETYENEIATLNAWMQTRDTRDLIMDPAARELGMGWFQEPSNKIWWTMLIGA